MAVLSGFDGESWARVTLALRSKVGGFEQYILVMRRAAIAVILGTMASMSESGVALFELGEALDDQGFADYLAALDRRIEAGEAFSMVIDGTRVQSSPLCRPDRRWQLQRAEALGRLHQGIAFVAGTMTRERMQVFSAMQAPGVAYAFLASRDEALAWAQRAVDGEPEAALNERKTVPFMPAVSG